MPAQHPSRRKFLAAGTATVTLAVAGCARVADWIADQVLEDVNIFNETDRQVRGTIELENSDGEKRLDESFRLAPPEDEDDAGESNEDAGDPNLGTYADVWTEAGEYHVTILLESAIDGESRTSETITIENPDEEMLLVPLGADDVDDPIGFRVGESFTEILGEE